jgi:hypothetical protein
MPVYLAVFFLLKAFVPDHAAFTGGDSISALMPRAAAAAAAALAIVITAAGVGAMAHAHADDLAGCVIITKQITCMNPPRTQLPRRPCNGANPSKFCVLWQEPA